MEGVLYSYIVVRAASHSMSWLFLFLDKNHLGSEQPQMEGIPLNVF